MLESSPQDRSASVSRSTRNRSAVTNRKRLFVEGDGRTPWARRWRDLVEVIRPSRARCVKATIPRAVMISAAVALL
jgi:hypothetical protein